MPNVSIVLFIGDESLDSGLCIGGSSNTDKTLSIAPVQSWSIVF